MRTTKTRASIFAFLILLLAGGAAFSYSFRESRLRSPLYVGGGKIVFVQDDDTLTVLDAKSGAVLRRTSRHASLVADSITVYGDDLLGSHRYFGLFLVDGETGAIRWRVKGSNAVRYRNTFICSDGNSTLFAVDGANGNTIWSSDLGEYTYFDVIGDRLYALHSITWEPSRCFVACLDAADGRLLWRREAPPDEFWSKMGLFDSDVYLLAGDLKGKPEDVVFDRLVGWSRDGTPLPPREPDAEDMGKAYWHFPKNRMRVGDDIYRPGTSYGDGVGNTTRTLTEAERKRIGLDWGDGEDGLDMAAGGTFVVSVLYSDGGRYSGPFVGRGFWTFFRESENPARRYHFIDGDIVWTGNPGYLNRSEANFIDQVASDADSLFIAASEGQLECLDRRTGESRWIYLFPARERVLSYSDEWRPFVSHIGEFLGNLWRYEREKRDGEVVGTIVEGRPPPATFRVTLDPEPVFPYPRYPAAVLLIFAILFLVPATLVLILAPLRGRGRPGCLGGIMIVCAIVSYPFLFMMGIFSPYMCLMTEMFQYSLVCIGVSFLYRSVNVEEKPSRWRRPALLAILFLPGVFWTVYATALTVSLACG